MSAIITVIGRATKDPETKTTSAGQSVVSFAVATNEGFGDKQTTSFWDVSVWDRLAENVPKFVRKGALIAVTGRARISEYQGKRRVDITGLTVERLDTKSESAPSSDAALAPSRAVAARPATAVAARPSPDATEIQDDDIPW